AGELDANGQADNPPGCPSVALIYGYVDVNSEAESQTTVLVCYQQLEETPTLVTLTYPDLLIPASRPPISGVDSVKQIEASGDGTLAFQFRPQLHFDRKLALFNQDVFDSSNSGRSPVDPFFQAVLFGRHPVSQAELASDSALARRRVSQGFQGVYGRYMAQAISANMRRPLSSANEGGDDSIAETLSATVTDPQGRLRVRQNNSSKLALQILLGTMFLCMALAVKIT
ncbi:MAG: hypothetical protein M1823_007447, partial [Watsoniomyces obsoletus]